jgi:hypothetical protein
MPITPRLSHPHPKIHAHFGSLNEYRFASPCLDLPRLITPLAPQPKE